MPEATITLAPPRQIRVAGITVGVLNISPDPKKPEAVVGVYNPELGAPESHRVRAGDQIEVAGRTVRVTGLVSGRGGHVDLTVTWQEET
jgi:hypothetical protein